MLGELREIAGIRHTQSLLAVHSSNRLGRAETYVNANLTRAISAELLTALDFRPLFERTVAKLTARRADADRFEQQ
mgnify:CR=1 FL=1